MNKIIKDKHYINININQDNLINMNNNNDDLINMNNNDDLKECRICLEYESDDEKLIIPCKCKGTHKYVHKTCLEKWRYTENEEDGYANNSVILNNRRKKCGICKTRYIEKKNQPDEDYFIRDSTCNYILVYAFMCFCLTIVVGFIDKSTRFAVKSIITDNHNQHLFYNLTSRDYNLYNGYIYSYSSNLLNTVLFVFYIYAVYKHINRFRFFIYKMSTFIGFYLLFYVFSFRILYYLFGDVSIHMFVYVAILLHSTSHFNIYLLKSIHNNTINKLNNKYNPSCVMPYDSINYNSDTDNDSDNTDDEHQPPPPPPPPPPQPVDENVHIIDIEEEIRALNNISEDELFAILNNEYEQNNNKHNHSYKDDQSNSSNESDSNSSNDSDSNSSNESDSDIEDTCYDKKKSKYVIQQQAYKKVSLTENEEDKIKPSIELVKKERDDEIVYVNNINTTLIHSSENTITNSNSENTNDTYSYLYNVMNTPLDGYSQDLIKESLDNTIDMVIKEILQETYNNNNTNTL